MIICWWIMHSASGKMKCQRGCLLPQSCNIAIPSDCCFLNLKHPCPHLRPATRYHEQMSFHLSMSLESRETINDPKKSRFRTIPDPTEADVFEIFARFRVQSVLLTVPMPCFGKYIEWNPTEIRNLSRLKYIRFIFNFSTD